MTVETQEANASENNAGGDQQTVESLQAEVTRLQGEAAKERNIRKQLQTERDAAKKAPKQDSNDEDYKKLWTQEREKAERLTSKAKEASIESTVKAKLTKAGILPDAIDAAAKLIDAGIIQWDEDSGVDEVSAQAAVAKLKGQYGFMFEKKVSATDPKQPTDGKLNLAKSMTRTEFDSLSPATKTERMKSGWKLTD